MTPTCVFLFVNAAVSVLTTGVLCYLLYKWEKR